MQPFVSVITPTYNRRKYIPILIELYKSQTYPKDRMEWVILDDGQDKVEDLFINATKTIPNIRYYYEPEKMTIGKKRNRLNELAKGDIIVAMDDDDYYPPNRVSYAVTSINRVPSIDLAGSSQMYLYYTDTHKIASIGPYGSNHATNGTMVYRKRYAKTHKYDETVTHAEERSFLEDYKHPMVQLDPQKSILVLCHDSNTFDKRTLRNGSGLGYKETAFKLKDFVKDSKIREFYLSIKMPQTA
jgi:glycosyltransferase involved in cell wall biosynthesis